MTARPTRDRLLLALAVAVNLAVLYWPRGPGGPQLPAVDKLVHLLVFAAVAWAGVRAGVSWRWLAGLLAVNAVVSELVQEWLLPGRSGDPLDVVADLAGVAIGIIGGSWRHDRRHRPVDRPAARRDPSVG